MPFYIIKTNKGYYEGFRDNVPAYSPEITHKVWVCGTSEEEAYDDFDFQRDLIIGADGMETQPALITIKSKPAPPAEPEIALKFKVTAPPPGWRVLDFFGKHLALLTDGKSFAIRTKTNNDLYTSGKEAAIHWCIIREQLLKARMDKLVGGDGGD